MATNENSSVAFTYDVLGNVIKEEFNGHSVISNYDKLARKTAVRSNLGADINFEFDLLDNIKSITAGGYSLHADYDPIKMNFSRKSTGNIIDQWQHDTIGRIKDHIIENASPLNTKKNHYQYRWDYSYTIKQINELSSGITQFRYDNCGALSKTIFKTGNEQIRNPDNVQNLFESENRNDRIYGPGSKLLKSRHAEYKYNAEGFLIEKKETNGKLWQYQWNSAGNLIKIINPAREEITFKYDALGRRIEKKYKKTITKWLWDFDKPLHEWKEFDAKESSAEDIITWVFEETQFTPCAKIKGKKSYSIICDHIGTPIQGYSETGQLVWERELDSYGNILTINGDDGFCNFLYPGQQLDSETGLVYNRFRYYAPQEGTYLSPDPIALNSGQLNLYAYVKDPNTWIDVFGLAGGGGSYSSVSRANKNSGRETHHMPADSVNRDTGAAGHGSAPAISMTERDHERTASHSSQGSEGAAHRARQEQHIRNGRYDLAMAMDIRDVNRIGRGRYRDSMLQAIEYARTRKPPLITDEQARNLRRQCK